MEIVLARVVHVLAVVLWIGGVAMVTTVILPAIKRMDSEEARISLFERLESRFSCQAKVTTLLTGLSGFYMMYVFDAWHRYTQVSFWWIHAMTLVWILFTLVLFVLEPLFLHRWFHDQGRKHPAKTLSLVHRFHVVLLILSLLTVAGAVAGSHGWFWF
jgi:uncharacterized membrane protein